MAKQQKPWGYSPRKATTSQLRETLKREVTTKANELIETVLSEKNLEYTLISCVHQLTEEQMTSRKQTR